MQSETKHGKWNKNPYRWTMILTLACILLTIVIAAFDIRFYRDGLVEETDKESYDKYYVMITEDNKSAIWQSVYQGACDHAVEENAYVDWLGDNLSEDYSVEDLMQIAIASDVDGIIVTADESDTLTDLINEAADAGIPVVTLYGDNTQSARCSFVGIGSYNLGREYGRQALQIAQRGEPCKVTVLVNSYTQDMDQNIICAGIQETIEQERDEEQEIALSIVSVDDTNAFSVEESIRDIFMEQEAPDIMICLNELTTTCVYQAVVDYNKVGDVSILGFYDSDTIVNAIDRNVIYATIAIDTRQMGSFCIDALTEYYELGYTSQYFTADIRLINKDNVSEYLEKGEDSDEIP
jgi:ribose transport system substrate-binding protein